MPRSVIWASSLGMGLWVAAIFGAPLALASSNRALSIGGVAVYTAGHLVCHQRPERSFSVGGRAMPVCARCTGLYVSAAAAVPLALLLASAVPSPRARLAIGVAALPTLVTWSLEYAGVLHFSNAARFLAALPLGFTAAWLVAGAAGVRGPGGVR